MTQRGGGLVIGDANGLFFADLVSNNAGHHAITLTAEKYCLQSGCNDFIEFKRDHFFVTILEANYFAIIQRQSGGGFFDSSKVTKVRSVHDNCLTMGISMVPGPRLDDAFVLVRDRRGVQLVNLKKATSHQLMLSPVPVQYTDMQFMSVIYDASKHETNLVTLYYGDYPKQIADTLDMSA